MGFPIFLPVIQYTVKLNGVKTRTAAFVESSRYPPNVIDIPILFISRFYSDPFLLNYNTSLLQFTLELPIAISTEALLLGDLDLKE